MKASKTRRFLIPAILCGMALVGIVYYYFFASFSKTDETRYVYIDDDDNADSVYHKLSDIATIHGLNAFTIMARHSGYADHVKTGRYAIKPGEGAFVVFRHIKNGMQTPVSLTIPSVRTIGRLSYARQYRDCNSTHRRGYMQEIWLRHHNNSMYVYSKHLRHLLEYFIREIPRSYG